MDQRFISQCGRYRARKIDRVILSGFQLNHCAVQKTIIDRFRDGANIRVVIVERRNDRAGAHSQRPEIPNPTGRRVLRLHDLLAAEISLVRAAIDRALEASPIPQHSVL